MYLKILTLIIHFDRFLKFYSPHRAQKGERQRRVDRRRVPEDGSNEIHSGSDPSENHNKTPVKRLPAGGAAQVLKKMHIYPSQITTEPKLCGL